MTCFRIALALAAAISAFAAEGVPSANGLVVHEWGTFTSVAGADGAPVTWTVLAGPSDLPCFVNRLGAVAIKAGAATVRMETPVLYFYAPTRTKVSVHVDFARGLITEWYPKANNQAYSQIEWGPFDVIPNTTADLPSTQGASHYYAARATDSALLDVGGQREKMLFYRGAGTPEVPMAPHVLPNGSLELRNIARQPIPVAFVFENRGGKIGYRLVRNLAGVEKVELPALSSSIDAVRNDLVEELTGAGLYPKEAQAMVATWRDSWFEEGARIFYILPHETVDAALPLRVSPAPQATARVFVGRVELLTPAMRDSLQTALAAGDVATLSKYGRFLDAFLHQVNRNQISAAASQFLNASYARVQDEYLHPSCEK